MSDTETSSSDDEFTTTRLRALLKAMRSDIDMALKSIAAVLEESIEPEETPKQLPLTQEGQELLGVEEATPQEALKILVRIWSQQGRLTVGGTSVKLPEATASLLHLPTEKAIHWSIVWKSLDSLFVK